MYGIHIEPLYKDPLNKKFLCKQCGNLFRTRQGLSGHIQFKHGTISQEKDKKKVEFKVTKKGIQEEFVYWKAILKPSKFEYEAVFDMFIWWMNVKFLFEGFGLELNEQDLHNYVITSLANIRQNSQLLKQLRATFN